MIDLAPMKGIYVDPTRGTARAQGGVTWREYNRATHVHGLATTGGIVSTTGIAGLTLGRRVGLAHGQIRYGHRQPPRRLKSSRLTVKTLTVTEETDADLFWGLRGGGGNFGVAASLEYRAHPVEQRARVASWPTRWPTR